MSRHRVNVARNSGTEKKKAKPPAWTHENLVTCIDGPMAGHWYTAKDWRIRCDAARHDWERGGTVTAGACLDYDLVEGVTVPHPKYTDDARGTVLRYRFAASVRRAS